jgi:hypothetical protein
VNKCILKIKYRELENARVCCDEMSGASTMIRVNKEKIIKSRYIGREK